MPEQVEVAAKLKGLSVEDFFKRFCAVDWLADDGNIFLIAPALKGFETGGMYPGDPKGCCIFLDSKNECEIYPARPFECSEYYHTDSIDKARKRHKRVGMAWKNHHGWIVELLGYEPMSEEYDSFNGLGWY